MTNFADGFGYGWLCLVLGSILMVWGACREPMMPTRPGVVSAQPMDVEESVPEFSPDDVDAMEEHVPVIARHEKGKAKR
jgi:hypothetical protein